MKQKKMIIICTALIILATHTQIGFAHNNIKLCQDTNADVISGLSGFIRQPAEFERMEAALISYSDLVDGENDFGIPYNLIAEIAEDVIVISIVESSAQQDEVEGLFETHDVNLDNCQFLIAPSNSYWTRDYGPWFVFNEANKEMNIVDFTYNRPRPDDNTIPTEFAQDQSLNYTFMDIIHTGGNYMTDGQGISISTELVSEENPGKTNDQINQIMNQNLGIGTYHLYPDVNDEYIKHIDCWAKYLSPDTILIREVPQNHPQYTEIEAAVDYFEMQTSCYDTPYDIVRVYTPNNEPYSNSLILNSKVFVPLQGTNWDDEAIDAYEQAMPGYEIHGFSADDDTWLSTDAIHCRIKGVPDREMLYINHFPLSGYDGFTVTATIIPFSQEDMEDVLLHWKVEGDDWQSQQMNKIGQNEYESYIPLEEFENEILYYIQAEDASGRIETHPFIGESDPHSFYVHNIPPSKPTIIGDNEGRIETEYEFNFSSEDPEDEMISYYIDWGDGNITTWTDYQPSDTSYSETHSWDKEGTYSIKAKSKDAQGAESAYTITQVSLPKNKGYIPFLMQFLEDHPQLFPLLRFFLL